MSAMASVVSAADPMCSKADRISATSFRYNSGGYSNCPSSASVLPVEMHVSTSWAFLSERRRK